MHRRSVKQTGAAEVGAGLVRIGPYSSVSRSEVYHVLSTLRLNAVLLGIGVGSLASTVAAVVVWFVLAALGVESAPDVALVVGIVLGLVIGGFTSGRATPLASRFHGMVTGLALAGLLLVIARLGGSPAPTAQVLLLALIGIVGGGIGGVLGGRWGRGAAPHP